MSADDGIEVQPRSCMEVKAGDKVIRWLAGVVRMPQLVTKVDEVFIYTGDPDNGWRFERENGFEFDPDLHMPPGVIVSFIVPAGADDD